jgi:Ring hydroxylating alpha subunit (catalytic domain)
VRGAGRDRAAGPLAAVAGRRLNQQDFAASEWCQPNMRSRVYANGGVLVPTEQEIIGRWYHQWYRDSMGLESAELGGSL